MKPDNWDYIEEEEKIGYRDAIDDIENFIDDLLYDPDRMRDECCIKVVNTIKEKMAELRKSTL